MTEVKGKQIYLPGGRCVFVARDINQDYLVEFTSSEGTIKRLKLSQEAMHALTVLNDCPKEHVFEIVNPVWRGTLSAKWQIVPDKEA